MPNAKRSGATRRKAAAAKSGSPAPTASTSGFTPSSNFTFSSPPPPSAARASPSPGPSSNNNGTKRKQTYAVPSSEESEDDSDEDDEEEESDEENSDPDDDIPEADEDTTPVEIPDDQLTPAEALIRAELRKETGNEFFKKKDYASATRLYSQAISLAPTNPAYLTNRAASYMSSRLYSSALADCVAAVALQLSSPQSKTLLRLARCQLALGLIPVAQQTLDQLLILDPSNPQVGQERARCARINVHIGNVKRELAKKNWSMVLLGIDAAAKEVEVTPREWRTWKVEALIGKKKYDEALGMAADLLRANPQQPEALYYRGLCLYYSGNHPQAILHCQEALRNDPDYVLARTLLRKVKLLDTLKIAGNDAFKENRLADAIEKYSEGLVVDEENDSMKATLLSNRATAYLRLKQNDKALEDCTTCLAIQPTYYKALRTKARIGLLNEDFEGALRDFKAAYELATTGSTDEAGLLREVKDAEIKLKKSKMKDHYKTLGIQSDATEDEIKKGYRRSSLIHHPDKGGSDEKFKEVGEAYAILSDPVRRRKFDSGIDESDPMAGHGHSPFDDMGHHHGGFGGGGFNMEDMFGGGGFGGGGGGRRGPYGY